MARKYSGYVLERVESGFKVICEAKDGTEAQSKAAEVAKANPGRVFVPATLWPPIMAREIRKVAFVNPDNPDELVTDVGDEAKDEKPAKTVEPVVQAPVVTQAPVVVAPVAPKAVESPTPTPVVTPASVAAPVVAPVVEAPAPVAKPAEAPVVPSVVTPKAAPKKKETPAPPPVVIPAASTSNDGFSSLFGEAEGESEGFVQEETTPKKESLF